MIAVEEIRRARDVLEGTTIRTPLVRLDADSDAEIWLKLEVLQPVRSFSCAAPATRFCRRAMPSSRAAS